MKLTIRYLARALLGAIHFPAICVLAGLYNIHRALARALGNLVVAPLALADGPTLTLPEMLSDVIDAFKKSFPALTWMGTDFRVGALKYLEKYIAHIVGIPTLSTYDKANGGYKNGATAARSLLTDIEIVINQWPTCPMSWQHVDFIKDKKNEYTLAMGNAGYAMAKGCMDKILAAITADTFSHTVNVPPGNWDYQTLNDLTGQGNTQTMARRGRCLLVNTPIANELFSDERIASKDYYGNLLGEESYRMATATGGFAAIIEYPDMPATLPAFAFDKRAIAILAGIPEQFDPALRTQLGIPSLMGFESIVDPETGIPMAAVGWQEPGVADLYWALTFVYGIALGKQKAANAADTLMDQAGFRITTQEVPAPDTEQ
ncbi:MAG: M13 family metallopeptidase [Opitutaceae bacterium]|jgi:hypothetical protein|nr:M13 family metallopeptidase [Opitutaceae bacterium]